MLRLQNRVRSGRELRMKCHAVRDSSTTETSCAFCGVRRRPFAWANAAFSPVTSTSASPACAIAGKKLSAGSREATQLVVHRAGGSGLNEGSQARIAGDAPEFRQLLQARQRFEAPFTPGPVEPIRQSPRRQQCATENVGVEDGPHRRWVAKRSARTVCSASSIAASISATGALALRALVCTTV